MFTADSLRQPWHTEGMGFLTSRVLMPLVTRLGSRTIIGIGGTLFVLNMLIPDPLPLIDEFLILAGTILLSRMAKGAEGSPRRAAKPRRGAQVRRNTSARARRRVQTGANSTRAVSNSPVTHKQSALEEGRHGRNHVSGRGVSARTLQPQVVHAFLFHFSFT